MNCLVEERRRWRCTHRSEEHGHKRRDPVIVMLLSKFVIFLISILYAGFELHDHFISCRVSFIANIKIFNPNWYVSQFSIFFYLDLHCRMLKSNQWVDITRKYNHWTFFILSIYIYYPRENQKQSYLNFFYKTEKDKIKDTRWKW